MMIGARIKRQKILQKHRDNRGFAKKKIKNHSKFATMGKYAKTCVCIF